MKKWLVIIPVCFALPSWLLEGEFEINNLYKRNDCFENDALRINGGPGALMQNNYAPVRVYQ